MGAGAAISARVSEECNRVSARDSSEEEGKLHEDLVPGAKVKEADAWKQFKVSEPFKKRDIPKAVVSTRWVLTWKAADGAKCVKSLLASKGYQEPELKDGNVDASGCVRLHSSHLRVIPLGPIETWKIWSLDTENASLQADGFSRDVCLRAPTKLRRAPRAPDAFGSYVRRPIV